MQNFQRPVSLAIRSISQGESTNWMDIASWSQTQLIQESALTWTSAFRFQRSFWPGLSTMKPTLMSTFNINLYSPVRYVQECFHSVLLHWTSFYMLSDPYKCQQPIFDGTSSQSCSNVED